MTILQFLSLIVICLTAITVVNIVCGGGHNNDKK